ncbi:hypothetical protein NFI96_001623 [Prochilodus magdalenae]|nr:hypothetical protein NFI96_001623 [Prochilodus magdalenae]
MTHGGHRWSLNVGAGGVETVSLALVRICLKGQPQYSDGSFASGGGASCKEERGDSGRRGASRPGDTRGEEGPARRCETARPSRQPLRDPECEERAQMGHQGLDTQVSALALVRAVSELMLREVFGLSCKVAIFGDTYRYDG